MESNLKAEIARRQIGTALALFIADDDPVSVHCLACGGGELADYLAKAAGETAFSQHALNEFPEMKRNELQTLRNKYWNAMKHASTLNGKVRSDNELLSQFDDSHNDHVLFIAWHDYTPATGSMPIEAQVFQAWYFANFPEKLALQVDASGYENIFPNIQAMKRSEKKRLLRRRIEWVRKNKDVMNHPKTDRRKLILGRASAPLPVISLP